jgi:hypothetical protein
MECALQKLKVNIKQDLQKLAYLTSNKTIKVYFMFLILIFLIYFTIKQLHDCLFL